MANLHVIKRSPVNDVSLEVLYNEQLSWGVSQKSMPILAEIEDRKSQSPTRQAVQRLCGPIHHGFTHQGGRICQEQKKIRSKRNCARDRWRPCSGGSTTRRSSTIWASSASTGRGSRPSMAQSPGTRWHICRGPATCGT